MAKKETKVLEYNYLGQGKEKALLPNKKKAILLYEEEQDPHSQKKPAKFYGYKNKFKSKDVRTGLPNYAFLIYDKKRPGFRLVPIENHVRFEK